MKTETTCPKCGAYLDEENLVHDGYTGSPHAHNGQGSYGLARHHYYFMCDCGWCDRPDKAAEKARRQKDRRMRGGMGTQRFDGLRLPPGAHSLAECVRLSCKSRLTLVERIAAELADKAGDIGSVCGHSLCSSYTYTLVPRQYYERAKVLMAGGVKRWAQFCAFERDGVATQTEAK